MNAIPLRSALISVFDKTGLKPLVSVLHQYGVQIYSTGGTLQYIQSLGIEVTAVEDLTGFPEVFGGRVKTLHPKVFGGILYRRGTDESEAEKHAIPSIDLVVVDLYPFEKTVAAGASHEEIIEKIDIGGISLLRAAAKNHASVGVVSSQDQYSLVKQWLETQKGTLNEHQRCWLAAEAFKVTSHYDTHIYHYLSKPDSLPVFKQSILTSTPLRYGENPHQSAVYFGDLTSVFDQLNGKDLSYNNLVDVDAALSLVREIGGTSCAIIKHTNTCGVARGKSAKDAYEAALSTDPVSAFGGVIALSVPVTEECAQSLNALFFEILIAPSYEPSALNLLSQKKNRILLQLKQFDPAPKAFKTIFNGILVQDQDLKMVTESDLKMVTHRKPTPKEIQCMIFANVLVKHAKSNTIVLAQQDSLIASGVGQTSRVDALKQALEKARNFNLDVKGAVMGSDAFFPFPDCVEIAHKAGIDLVIQPGGSVKDQDSIDFCNAHNMCMVFTGFRHFKH